MTRRNNNHFQNDERSLRKTIESLNYEVAIHKAQLNSAQAEIARLKAENELIKTGLSWRITAPLRAAKEIVRSATSRVSGRHDRLPMARYEDAQRGVRNTSAVGRNSTTATADALKVFEVGPLEETIDLPKMRIAVQLHLFYPTMAEEFADYLSNIPVPFDLLLSLPEGVEHASICETFQTRASQLQTIAARNTPNRGRDIAPFVVEFGEKLLEYDIICHIHSKKSPHNSAKRNWRAFLLSHLLGSPRTVLGILETLSSNEQLGILFPQYHPSLRDQISWGSNLPAVRELGNRLQFSVDEKRCPLFPAGSMIWAKSKALAPLFKAGLRYDDFPAELGQVDGTLAHAIERLFTVIAESEHYRAEQFSLEVEPEKLNYFHPGRPYRATNNRELQESQLIEHQKWTAPRNVVVCTTIVGEYDQLLLPEHIVPEFEYVCFSTHQTDGLGLWKLRPCDFIHADPTRMSRYVKTHLLEYFPDKQAVIWVDANVLIRGDLRKYVALLQASGSPVGGVIHPMRTSAYEEAQECQRLNRDASEIISAQMSFYRQQGFVPKRLIETGFMVFTKQNSALRPAMLDWWDQISKFSRRDQLSCDYVMEKHGLSWLPLLPDGYSVRNHPDFALLSHGGQSGYVLPSFATQRERMHADTPSAV